MNIAKCKLIKLDSYSHNAGGQLTVVEGNNHLPFTIERIYYLHDVPKLTQRGVHAHKKLQQLIIAVSGSFVITIDDGTSKKSIKMCDPTQGLYICPMIWREIDHFSSDAVLMVLASTKYHEDDYIHEYDKFIEYRNRLKK